MKKTYMTPEMLAVSLQHTSIICAMSITDVDGDGNQNSETGIDYGGEAGENEGFLGKAVTSQTLWDNEW